MSQGEAVWVNVRTLWRDSGVRGLERLFDTLLLLLRFLSLSFFLKRFLPDPDDARRAVRSSVIDAYCVLQLVALVILLSASLGPVVETVIAAYILFEIYLTLLNMIFIGTIRAIIVPPASIERTILLLFMNVLQVVLAFAIFYQHWLGLSAVDAFFNAVLVLGTIGYPTAAAGWRCLLVSLQVLLDLVLVVVILGSFVGQMTLFRGNSEPSRTTASNDPLQPHGSAGG